MKEFITHSTVSNIDFVILLLPPYPLGPMRVRQRDPGGATQQICCTVDLQHSWGTLNKRSQNLLQRTASKLALALEGGVKNYTANRKIYPLLQMGAQSSSSQVICYIPTFLER